MGRVYESVHLGESPVAKGGIEALANGVASL